MFAQRLKELRLKRGLTQAELASALNISNRTISMYEQSNSEPNVEILAKIADYFNVTTDFLVGRTDYSRTEYQLASDCLGLEEKTIEILQTLSNTATSPKELDYLEAIIQHPQFPALLNSINQYVICEKKGWRDSLVQDPTSGTSFSISATILKTSAMRLILDTFQGIVAGLPYSSHFVSKPPTTE